jgi:hypothetical protein
MAGTRSAPGSTSLALDGIPCGFVRSADGGDVYGLVVKEKVGPDFFVKKHIGGVKYEEIHVQVGLDLAQNFYDWIVASWKENYSRKDGSVIVSDANLNAVTELDFFHAIVTDVTFPALDAASKDAFHLDVKLAPEYTRRKKGAGKVTAAKPKKPALASSFRVDLDGLPTAKVSRVESFTVSQTIVTDDIGDGRDVATEPGKLDFPNLTITLAAAGADAWSQWADDLIVQGKDQDSNEKNGAIVLLSSDLKTELARVSLFGVGIWRLRRVPPKLVADLYCERMELQVGKPAAKPADPPAPAPAPGPEVPATPISRTPIATPVITRTPRVPG